MKKLFAFALAATMAAGMTTVAFAASENVVIGKEIYKLGSDNRAEDLDTDQLEGGDQLVIPIYVWEDANDNDVIDGSEAGSIYAYTSDYDRRVVARADWKVGDAEVTTGYVNYGDVKDKPDGYVNRQIMSVIITLPENDTTTIEDLAGTVSVGRSASSAKNSPKTCEVEVSYYPDHTRQKPWDGSELISGHTGIVSFDSADGEVDIDFEDVATFTVDVTSQGKLNLAWNTDFNKEFGAMYDYANLTFFNLEGTPSFNKNGTLMVYAEPDTFFYEVTADGAKAVDAEYDEDYEAWVLTTRTLSSYVVSDVELTEKTVTDTEDGSSTTDDGSKPIPDTGR